MVDTKFITRPSETDYPPHLTAQKLVPVLSALLEGGATYNRLSRCLATELFYCGLVRRSVDGGRSGTVRQLVKFTSIDER